MLLTDYPIEEKDSDKLRRAPLAEKVAELIKGFQGKESFVIGIEGVWGSGKTSFINLVLNGLRGNNNILFVHFNPWNFSGQNELIADFFATLHSSIKNESGVKDLSKTLRSYASKLQVSFSPSIPIPFLGSVGLGELWKKGGMTLQEERKKIDEQLKALSKKIVIVVDDIDRLDTDETRLIMKLVKMTANFPNTAFLLAYDRDRVATKLNDGDAGEEYLKKIIQVSFTLPKPDEQGLKNILFSDLDKTIEGVYGEVKLEGEDEKRWGQIVYAGFPKLFVTIRDIKRYINSLHLNWSVVGKDNINMVDFIAVESIRVFAPALYSAISGNKSLFTEHDSDHASFRRQGEESRATRYKALLEKVPENIRPIVDKICEELFPQLGSGYGHDWQQEWRRSRRICAEERFNFYFQLGIPEGAISETEITEVFKQLESIEAFSKSIQEYKTDKRLRPLLSKILDYTDKLTKATTKNLILTLWNAEKEINDAREVMFDFDDVETQTLRLAYHSIKKAVPKTERGAFLDEIVKESKTLYPPVHLIAVLEQELEKQGRAEDDYLVQTTDIEASKQTLLERIKSMAEDGSLSTEKNFAFFLYRWKQWENEDEVKKYVATLTATREGLLAYLKGFVGKVLSSAGNYNRLDKTSTANFISQENLDALVNAITDDEFEKLGEAEKEAVTLYKNPPKRNGWD